MTVSICIITYNHEHYIAEAIESVLLQQTSFEIELVIGEDGSEDATRSICEDYANRYPEKIKLLPAAGNKGMMDNFLYSLAACTGKYIAFIEGDDYWTDTAKLQMQVDFLEKNPDYSLCFHNAMIKKVKDNQFSEWLFHKQPLKDTHQTEDLLKQWYIPTASVVFVNYPDLVIPDWFQYCKSGDIPFLLLLSLRGKFKYMHQTMSVYRIHDKGISGTHNGYNKIIAMIFIYENFNIYTKFRYSKKIKEASIYEINRHFPGNDHIYHNTGLKNTLYKKSLSGLFNYIKKVQLK